ncbi:MAG: ABC transporter permease, partial [Vicinamibacterales bacterium]
MSPAPAARRSVRRLATRLYTAALRLLPDALPPGGRGAAAEAFDALQDEAWQARGARGLAGCWLAETGSLARLLAPRPHLPRRPMTMLTHDLRDAYRALRRSPGFTLVVVVTLALGIGMNTAIFSVVDALLFKSLPYADAERLVLVAERHPLGGRNTVAPANFLDWQACATSFTGLAARQSRTETLLDGDEPRTLRGALVSVNYFALLGVDAALGRVFADADGRPDAPCAVVISHRLFAQQLGADTARLGRDLAFAGERCTLVGVLPADSVFDRGAYDVYRPLVLGPGATRSSHFLTVFGRLAPGTTVARADAEMVAVAAAISGEHPEIELDWSATVVPLRDVVVRADTARLAWVLMGAVALVLLIATVNIAGLGLSRAVARRPEVSVRVALGAGRWRVFRGLLVESLLLSATGAAIGVGVGRIALRAFSAYMPAGTLPAEAIATLDGRALAFTALLAVVTGLLAGTVPAWHGARDHVSGALRSTGRSVSGSRASARLHGGLLVTEIALAMILVTGAALLVASFVRLTRVSPGFDASDVLTLRLSL